MEHLDEETAIVLLKTDCVVYSLTGVTIQDVTDVAKVLLQQGPKTPSFTLVVGLSFEGTINVHVDRNRVSPFGF